MTKRRAAGKQGAKARGNSGTGPSPLPSTLLSERSLQDIHRLLEGKKFASGRDLDEFLRGLSGPGLENALEDAPSRSPRQEAQEFAYQSMEASSRKEALALARKAVAIDPDCADALVTLAACESRTAAELITGFRAATAAGERALGADFFREHRGRFWGILETRPYMRARQQLAEALLDFGDRKEGIQHLEGLLDLNPDDNQGVRDTLLGAYLECDDLQGAGRLLRQFAGDSTAVFAWGGTLERLLSADFPGAERELRSARAQNRFVEEYLRGIRKLPRDFPDSYVLGSEEEAILCMEAMSGAWMAHPEAMIWLLMQLEAPTPPLRIF